MVSFARAQGLTKIHTHAPLKEWAMKPLLAYKAHCAVVLSPLNGE
jgi:hypothetical protein